MLKSKVVNINIGCGSRITKGYIKKNERSVSR